MNRFSSITYAFSVTFSRKLSHCRFFLQTMMASEALELSSAGRDIPGHPDYRRLHSEENTAATKRPGIKKSISWGNRSDAMRTLSFQRKFILW